MINLLKDCMDASEKHFVSCVKTKKDEWDEVKDILEDQMIKLALNKHVNEKRDGQWKALS